MSSLKANRITRHFGGVVALKDVTLELRPGEVHGLIGPNGSGKTTLLNLLSGFYTPSEGTVELGDEDLTRRTVQRRAQVGVARTFQKPYLLGALSVLDNCMLGGWSQTQSGFVAAGLALPRARSEIEKMRARAQQLLRGVGLGYAMDRRANTLEHSEMRFLEIARSLCMRPRFLLLDEPAGGLTHSEIDALGTIVDTVKGLGVGVLLVEHHTDFVFRISDRVTTLNLGGVIFQGTAGEARSNAEVIRVYLGESQ